MFASTKTNTSNHDRVHMALEDEMELNDFLEPSQVATQEIDPSAEENTNNLLNSLTKNIKNCKYFDLDQNQITINEKHSLVLLHLNIRTLQKCFDLLFEFLTTLNFSADIVCLTETRIKSQPLINVEIPNYSFVHVDSESAADVVAIYVFDRFQYELRSNQYHLTGTECLWLNKYESNSEKKIYCRRGLSASKLI